MSEDKKTLQIGAEYARALEVINDSYYQCENLGRTIEDMIEDHLIREKGRLGKMLDGKYI